MLNVNQAVKKQIKLLSEKENYFLLTEIEPDYQHNFMEVSFKTNENNFEILDLVKLGEVYKTFNYEDIKDVDIDSILVSLNLKDGTTYFLHEVRTDLSEILEDFNSDCCITKYKIIEEDGETKYNTEYYFVMEDYNVVDNKEDNTVEIKNELGGYILNYNDILSMEEDYMGGGSNRSVRINLGNDEYITIESL